MTAASSGVTDMAEAMTMLGDLLREAKRESRLGLSELTVLSPQNDPYRIDTPTFHEAGRWFRDQLDRLGLAGKHLRGIHYALLGSTALPNGQPYVNTGENWDWLQDVAAKAARWLGYVPFEAIRDQRNAAPVVRVTEEADPGRGGGREPQGTPCGSRPRHGRAGDRLARDRDARARMRRRRADAGRLRHAAGRGDQPAEGEEALRVARAHRGLGAYPSGWPLLFVASISSMTRCKGEDSQ
jgi:hypothetical protein